jgi:hypothetical protein
MDLPGALVMLALSTAAYCDRTPAPAIRLVLASNNAKKPAELRAPFAGLDVDLVPQGEVCVPEAAGLHATFIENARAKKAQAAASAAGGAALANDSGVCVDALGGGRGKIRADRAPGGLRGATTDAGRSLPCVIVRGCIVSSSSGAGPCSA